MSAARAKTVGVGKVVGDAAARSAVRKEVESYLANPRMNTNRAGDVVVCPEVGL